jgi:hypothetical protein
LLNEAEQRYLAHGAEDSTMQSLGHKPAEKGQRCSGRP